MMQLYYCDVLQPRKACAVARHLGSPVEFVRLDLKAGEHKTPAYLALNPNGKVPTLVDGSTVVWEADAILCHLARRAGSDLWPADDADKVEVFRWFSFGAHHFTRSAGDLYFEHVIKSRFGLGAPDPEAVALAQDRFRQHAAVAEAHLKGREWLLGEALTVADFSLAISLPYAEKAAIPLDAFPEIRRWHGQLEQLDAWRNPFPAVEAV